MTLFVDGVAFVLGNMYGGDRGHAAVTAVWADLDATVDTFFCERQKSLGEDSCGGIPSKLRLEHLTDAGKRHGIDLKNLNRDCGTLGRALADPGFEFARRDCRPWLQLHIADRQFAGIGVGLTDDGGKADGGMLKQV
jgi:hypothetical protein